MRKNRFSTPPPRHKNFGFINQESTIITKNYFARNINVIIFVSHGTDKPLPWFFI